MRAGWPIAGKRAADHGDKPSPPGSPSSRARHRAAPRRGPWRRQPDQAFPDPPHHPASIRSTRKTATRPPIARSAGQRQNRRASESAAAGLLRQDNSFMAKMWLLALADAQKHHMLGSTGRLGGKTIHRAFIDSLTRSAPWPRSKLVAGALRGQTAETASLPTRREKAARPMFRVRGGTALLRIAWSNECPPNWLNIR